MNFNSKGDACPLRMHGFMNFPCSTQGKIISTKPDKKMPLYIEAFFLRAANTPLLVY
jgi:hypothetical protein